jgi:hypothetical protein
MLLSRMSDTPGNVGSHAQAYAEHLKYQEEILDQSNAKGGSDSQDDSSKSSDELADLPSYEVKLGDVKSSIGHKKNLSETFDDILNITTDTTPKQMPELSPPADPVEDSSDPDLRQEPEVVPAKLIEAKHRFANPDHLSFEPTAQAISGASFNPTTSRGGEYHATVGESCHQYTQPSQATGSYPMPPPPPMLTPSSTDSRKHRREISEHQPMAHRRKNTSGELEDTKWSYADRDNEVDIMAPIQDHQYQASPASNSPPTISAAYFLQGYTQPPFGGGFYAPPISSAHSDSGAGYNLGSVPVLASFYGQSNSLRTSPNPGLYHSAQPHYPFQGYQGYDAYTTDLMPGGYDDHQHPDLHHRKQSSLGAFLATTGIFEEVFHEMENKGYESAPDNIEEHAIQATTEPIAYGSTEQLSSSFLNKKMSDDAFFNQFYRAIHEDDDAPVIASDGPRNFSSESAASLPCLPAGFGLQPNTFNPNSIPKLALKKQISAPDPSRHRRKCAVDACPNRVVQGGLCISHGAKRKTCNFPGCTKNVKKQGKCSAHGPERKRCEAEGCTKVAVQGGKCISHGAKKKGCAVEGCAKQSIMGGMCKKHYDEYRECNALVLSIETIVYLHIIAFQSLSF